MPPCPCISNPSLSCACSIAAGSCIDVSGSGTPGAPFVLAPILDPSVHNLLTCGSIDGLSVRAALGAVAHVRVEADQTGITGTGTPLAGLSASFTAIATRLYRVTWHSVGMTCSEANDEWLFSMKEGITTFQGRYATIINTNRNEAGGDVIFDSGWSAGVHTVQCYLECAVGSGTGVHLASANAPSTLTIEDLGEAP